jgi:hypothetical protein
MHFREKAQDSKRCRHHVCCWLFAAFVFTVLQHFDDFGTAFLSCHGANMTNTLKIRLLIGQVMGAR